jgi:hypothetical protein
VCRLEAGHHEGNGGGETGTNGDRLVHHPPLSIGCAHQSKPNLGNSFRFSRGLIYRILESATVLNVSPKTDTVAKSTLRMLYFEFVGPSKRKGNR